MYKATFNRSGEYLVHFNKNHSSKNGQFTSGDGDGDGIADDHHNQKADKKRDKELKTFGSERTTKYLDDADSTARSRTIGQVKRNLKKFAKSSRQDEEAAQKSGDEKRAAQIRSGRLFVKSQTDAGYANKTVNDAFRQAANSMNFDPARGFKYSITRNEKQGGINIKIDNMMGDSKTIFIDYE